ncbi:hypothetical protein PLESTB_001231600 [Pleodorina starrii]|uniref:Uncharacterized protein n=1 Tax=Pleodorina starrii TaxID=330485 RepID=A0A9W6F6F8_9CHLO|nr:hypothetical protein PLESTM_000228100 [Pleodorina starrii]GLC57481.1 hypothetical protein PLESTB_001231600 [Pleodorina starrii]GLC63154.1 hypothetical protein PLESTF_000005700 [Pleodorina starrii]
MADPLQKAQERLSLHELIRVGVGRQEDLRLLQNVAMQAACLPAASVAQLLREAALREEWRSGRDAALLALLRSQGVLLGLGLGPGGCLSAADGRLLSEQVAALTEMLEQQQQRKRSRAAASGPGQWAFGASPISRKAASAGLGVAGSPVSPIAASIPLRPYLAPLAGRPPPSPSPSPPQQQQQPVYLGGAARGAEGLGRQLLQRPASTPAGDIQHSGLTRSVSAGIEGSNGRGYEAAQEGLTPRQRRVVSPGGCTSTASAAAIYGTAVVGSPARALRSGGRAPGQSRGSGSGQGGQAYASPVRQTRGSSPGQTWPRPGSAPDGAAWAAARAAGVEPALAASTAAAAVAAAAAVNSPSTAGGGSPAGEGAQRSSGFRNLLRLQRLLLQGLREHAQDDGEGGALEALASSVAEGQAFFAECLTDALEAAGLPPDTVALSPALARVPHQQGQGQGQLLPGSPGRRAPVVAWDKMLRLGQLGLTRSDVARLEEIRRQRAARVIQRQVRKWLRRRRHQRRLAEARARADAMQRKLRDRAARVIQAWVRGHLARRLAARLAVQAAAEREQRRRAEAARAAAATRIQRAWRAHRRAVRYAAALARAEELRRQREQQQQQEPLWRPAETETEAETKAVAGPGRVQEPQATAFPRGQEQGAERGLRAPRRDGISSMPLEKAVVVIQSHLRGWLVRRSSDLWWARASHSLRERRAAVRAWQQHQRFMAASYDMQAQLLGAMVREAQVAEALAADRRRQEGELRAAFNEWLLQQQRVALSQPLPRGWVPHPHPDQPGRMCFLNTRTGELHALHPAVSELARHAREQHSAALSSLQQRFSGVPAYLASLHAATAAQADIAMRAIAIMYQQSGTAGAVAGPAGEGRASRSGA